MEDSAISVELLPYVLAFLRENGFKKASKALCKEFKVEIESGKHEATLKDFYEAYEREQSKSQEAKESETDAQKEKMASDSSEKDRKRKLEQSAVENEEETAEEESTKKKKKKRRKESTEPFRRVKGEDIEINEKFANNSFHAKAGSRGSWGEKAYNDLKTTKGKSFRHEKTKKKRGSYRGGAIDTSVCSVKFDEEE